MILANEKPGSYANVAPKDAHVVVLHLDGLGPPPRVVA